jgi:pectate lyase
VTTGGLPNLVAQQGHPETSSSYTISAGSSSWTNYTTQASVRPGANDLNQTSDLMARYTDASNHYSFLLKNSNEWYLGKRVSGTWTTLAQGTFAYGSTFYTLTLTTVGSTISGAINGHVVASVTDDSFTSGMIAFQTSAESELDNVAVSAPGGGASPTPNPPTPATGSTHAPSAACATVISGEIKLGQCSGTFTRGAAATASAAPCIELVGGAMELGSCEGTFTPAP